MRKTGFLILFVTLFAVTGFAQNYGVGDRIEFQCNDCFGRSGWVAGTIEGTSGETYQIRYGTESRQFRTGIPRRLLREADFAQKEDQRRQFRNEASGYKGSVFALMQIHDPDLRDGNGYHLPPVTGAEWTKLKADLAALDNLCKTKYAGMTNGSPGNPTELYQLPATWCEIAARRDEYQGKGIQMAAANRYRPFLGPMVATIQEAIDNPGEYIDEDIQLLMYERQKWRAKQSPQFQKGFADLGVSMPSDFFKDIEGKADQLKVINEQTAPTRSFLMPKQRDAAVEAFICGRYATQLKGVQIVKLGVDDASWQVHRNSLGIPLSQTKVSRLLVRVPNRPFCQEHSVAVERKYKGGTLGAMAVEGNVGSEGLYMKCE